ncbi:MAG: addiction module protein [Polyangiaceae bacterium]|jgi:hypothetical protein|nr:addiction module protein [Polyangiaceae bacterium]MBK6520195.1 addiction module protein [Polyangiaceae bacterium]
MTAREILQAALALSPEERARLVDEIEASLHVEISAQMLTLIDERIARARAGEPGIPADQVFAEARRR